MLHVLRHSHKTLVAIIIRRCIVNITEMNFAHSGRRKKIPRFQCSRKLVASVIHVTPIQIEISDL